MTAPQGYRLISPAPERDADILHVAEFGFAFTVPAHEVAHFSETVPHDRNRAIETTDAARGPVGEFAAVHSSFPFTTRVPGGGTVTTAGLTLVAVHPGHRRRGLMRAMMTDHFTRSLARGEVISTLFASEGGIYSRFGYGMATHGVRLELGRGTGLREVEGADALTVTIDSSDIARHGEVLRAVQARMDRPGTATTLSDESVADIFLDPESHRAGHEQRRIAVVTDGDSPVAYALFHRAYRDSGPQVMVRAWGAVHARASRRLWSVMTDLDLMGATHADRFGHDDPLIYLLKDPTVAKMSAADNLWLRILDLPAALTARGWSADCDVTVAVKDDQLADNAGTWRITAVDGTARVTRTADSANVSLTIEDLSTVYLGGPTLTALARASLVTEHRVGAVDELSRALAGDIAPVANFSF